MNINKKLIKYLKFKKISQRSFSLTMELSEGILRRGNNLGSMHFIKLKTHFPDLNINWLLFDDGEMILQNHFYTNEPTEIYKIETKSELISLQREQISLQRELLNAKETIIELTNTISDLKNK